MALVRGNAPVVLVVGLPDSIHTARWVDMLVGRGMQIVLLGVYDTPVANFNCKVRTVSNADDVAACTANELAVFDVDSVSEAELQAVASAVKPIDWRPPWLGKLVLTQPGHLVVAVQRLRPALVHSMVVQLGGYLALDAREFLKDAFPPWLVSNWGSDIFLFRHLPEHRDRIERIASLIDGYHAECERDIRLIRRLGFQGFVFPPIPASGGMDFTRFPPLDSFPQPSRRREIIVKGYHNWAGRGLHVLSALHLVAGAIRPYRIRIILASDQVSRAALTMAAADDLDVVIDPYLPDHSEALARLGRARAIVGLGIADGISTTLLEAMSVGAFPVQGLSSCGDEWVVNGKTGMLVDPNDIRALAEALRIAATDDVLVDEAALLNRAVVERRWNTAINAETAEQSYKRFLAHVIPQTCAYV